MDYDFNSFLFINFVVRDKLEMFFCYSLVKFRFYINRFRIDFCIILCDRDYRIRVLR